MPSTRSRVKHAFFETIGVNPDGTPKLRRIWVKVRHGTRRVEIVVTADDARRSVLLHGAGNTRLCAASNCVQRSEANFPHKVTGIVDWQASTVFIVSKEDRNGMPLECVRYRHRDNGENAIWKLNDTPAHLRKLVRLLEQNGPRTIVLYPTHDRTGEDPRPRPAGRRTGTRSSRASTGALKRYEVAHPGVTPPAMLTRGRR